ncbi:anti-sigma factor domain-containing protein [Methylibium sp.]|uniref:anti-sigma factor n=1 Tax=Methylibium sp. TaxID=2067992 RepID=UPI00286A3745|nr:anti-sigma factor [Methylibium sp.]
MNLGEPEDRSVAAGEYVLGTQDAEARAAFEQALAADAALQAEIYVWQDRLLGLVGRVAPAEPPLQMWPQIEAKIAAPVIAPRATGVPMPGTDTARPSANDPLWRRLRRWQMTGGLAIAASLVLASLLVLRAPAPAESQRYLAVLQSPDLTAGWVVEASARGGVRLVPVGTTAPVPPGKALQFWTKPLGAAGPTSLGLVRPGQVTELPAARLPALGEQQLFELTLEPETGSPIGRPTGPILFVGKTVRL